MSVNTRYYGTVETVGDEHFVMRTSGYIITVPLPSMKEIKVGQFLIVQGESILAQKTNIPSKDIPFGNYIALVVVPSEIREFNVR